MDLYLVRHAIAEEHRMDLPDADRQLTQRGRERFDRVVATLGRAEVAFDRVYHSPWRRAVQTAELLAPINQGDRIATDGLAQNPTADFFRSLEGERVACVGHEPWMSDAVALLAAGDDDGSWLRFKKGGVAWLQGLPGTGTMELAGFWAPKLLLSV